MKPRTLSAIALAVLTSCLAYQAQADFSINFRTTPAASKVYNTSSFTVGNEATGWLLQLIWSPDNTPTPLNPSDPLSLGSGEIELIRLSPVTTAGQIKSADYNSAPLPALAQPGFTWLADSTTQTYSENNYGLAANGFMNGYVLARIFSDTAPAAGETYHQFALSGSVPDSSSGPTPTVTYSITTSTYFDTTIVPEPSTYALFGMGIVIVGLVRKFRA